MKRAFFAQNTETHTLDRPQFFVFPDDETGAAIDNQFYVGSSGLLAKPITSKGTTETTLYLSDKQVREAVALV